MTVARVVPYVAPMSLVTYEDAGPWARSIKEPVARRHMLALVKVTVTGARHSAR
jgi:hypothetical protein